MVRLRLLLLFLIVSRFAFADVPLSDLLKGHDIGFQWEPYRKIGVLYKGGERLTFKPGMDSVLVDFTSLEHVGKIEMHDGVIVFSDSAAQFVKSFFTSITPPDVPTIAAIVLDPGHGGKDPGTNHTHVINGKTIHVVEKDVVLAVAKDLDRLLLARYPGKKIIMTRTNDTYIPLEERVQIANSIKLNSDKQAIIFVSIHANASFSDKSSHGFEVWYLPPDYARTNLVTKNQDNATVLPILNMMKDEEFTMESVLLGRELLAGLEGTIGNVTIDRGLKQESWFVVRNARMPSVLVELGFVTNPEEALRMTEPTYLHKMAEGLYNGVTAFVSDFESGFKEKVPPQ